MENDFTTPGKIDPNLREAYQRIMENSKEDNQDSTQQAPILHELKQEAKNSPKTENNLPDDKLNNNENYNTPKPLLAIKKKNGMKNLLIFLGVILFIIFYTVVWAKIFKLF